MSGATPLPRVGDVFFDHRGEERALRLSWHPDAGVMVLSIWNRGNCTGTFRLPAGDIPALVEALSQGLPVAAPRGRRHASGPDAAPEPDALDPLVPGQAGGAGVFAATGQYEMSGRAGHTVADPAAPWPSTTRPDPLADPLNIGADRQFPSTGEYCPPERDY